MNTAGWLGGYARRASGAAAFSIACPLVLILGALLESQAPTMYYELVQEDGPLEWATFWAFVLAAALAARAAVPAGGAWRLVYLGGFALGCLLVALEEISWGQRLFSFRPPELFLSRNYQQELNLHNLAGSDLRRAALQALLLGFGVLLPLAGRLGPTARWLSHRQIPVPAVILAPGFLLAATLYEWYPWHNTGEWVECLAGLGFLAAGWDVARREAASGFGAVGVLLAALALGSATPALVPADAALERRELAGTEVRALAADFAARRLRSRCGVHKRVHTFVREYGARRLDAGEYRNLADPDGSHETRRAWFLDPWNQPYWIRDECDGARAERIAYVYSFGPDRRRDSSARGIGGDDVGAYVAAPAGR